MTSFRNKTKSSSADLSVVRFAKSHRSLLFTNYRHHLKIGTILLISMFLFYSIFWFVPTDSNLSPFICRSDIKPIFIIGAGLAGVTAAQYLESHTKNCLVILLEARHRIGGRIWTLSLQDPYDSYLNSSRETSNDLDRLISKKKLPLLYDQKTNDSFKSLVQNFEGTDLGAGWVHNYNDNPIFVEAEKRGIETTFVGGDSSYIGGKNIKLYTPDGKLVSVRDKERSFLLVKIIWNLVKETMETFPEKRVMSMTEFLKDIFQSRLWRSFQITLMDRMLISWHFEVVFGGDWATSCDQLSLRSFYENSPFNFSNLDTNEFKRHNSSHVIGQNFDDSNDDYSKGDYVFSPPQGYNGLVWSMAKNLDILLNHQVIKINYTSTDHIQLNLKHRSSLQASAVIVTVPLGVLKAKDIHFEPPWPKKKLQSISRLSMGQLDRVILQFKHRFWDHQQYSFGFITDIKNQFDDIPTFMTRVHASSSSSTTELLWPLSMAVNPEWEKENPLSLIFLIGGASHSAMMRMSSTKIVSYIMRHLVKVFGPKIPNPHRYIVTNWRDDPMSRGAYSTFFLNGSNKDIIELARPLYSKSSQTLTAKRSANVFFAGEHTVVGHDRACTSGAYKSGERASKQLLTEFAKKNFFDETS